MSDAREWLSGSGHSIAWTIGKYGDINATVTCHEPLTAKCHIYCDCEVMTECGGGIECDEWDHKDPGGPHCSNGELFKQSPECTLVTWLVEDSSIEDCYAGKETRLRDGRIDIDWTGDRYEWTYWTPPPCSAE